MVLESSEVIPNHSKHKSKPFPKSRPNINQISNNSTYNSSIQQTTSNSTIYNSSFNKPPHN